MTQISYIILPAPACVRYNRGLLGSVEFRERCPVNSFTLQSEEC